MTQQLASPVSFVNVKAIGALGIPAQAYRALAELVRAANYARCSGKSLWDFAVEIELLRTLGMTESDLRWLLSKGFVEHAHEITGLEENGRHFLPLGNLSFSKSTCFILTEYGGLAAREISGGSPAVVPPKQSESPEINTASPCECESHSNGTHFSPILATTGHSVNSMIPQWDSERHELRFDGKLVKRFKWPALNQELLLCAFQEEGWPARIDDPLPQQAEQDPKRRLHDTIKCLNRKQHDPLVHFRGDGTGEGIIWEANGCAQFFDAS